MNKSPNFLQSSKRVSASYAEPVDHSISAHAAEVVRAVHDESQIHGYLASNARIE